MKEVHKESAADRDGRLRKGDLILAVNDRSMRDIAFKDAVTVLKEASTPLRLLILRENAQKLFTSHQCRYDFGYYFVFIALLPNKSIFCSILY